MAGEVFCSCLICRIPLFYQRPIPDGIDQDEDDEYQSDDYDWRNIWHNDFRIHSSCLAIAIPAAADRKTELLAKLCHRSLRYDLFPLLAVIPHPAFDPNQISKNLALAVVREINTSSWRDRIPEEIYRPRIDKYSARNKFRYSYLVVSLRQSPRTKQFNNNSSERRDSTCVS
jgi:hypothetical protein